ncbi:MAG: valine--tRNA ligase [Candidatus Aenigmatarchaeota archaeon]
MEKRYEPKEVEARILDFWEDQKVFAFDRKSKKPIFSIDTPPPTTSGKLHIGHIMHFSQFEFVARYRRMRGFNVFFPFGFDDNGLATELLTEKKRKIRAEDMTRKEFRQAVEEVSKEMEDYYRSIWTKIGLSCDWSLLYRTIDKRIQRISQLSFLDLYKKGRVYRMECPTLWCPKCHMALAQTELEDKEIDSKFVYLSFGLEDGGKLLIATTRPELLGSCVAIFVNKEDKKHSQLIGKKATVPLFGHKVPILEDYRADPEKGTGVVMCCTFGDQTDIEWYKAHKLPIKMSINEKGIMTKQAGKYEGLKIKQAREKVIEDLKKEGLIEKEEPVTHPVNVHERCGTALEFIVSKQWFIRYLDMKKELLEAGNKMNWYPEFMKVRYDNWVNGLQWDWCISRQRYFGVPIPVWYCKKCGKEIVADEKEIPIDPLFDNVKKKCECGGDGEPEKDVFDTWNTSSLTPLINAGWSEENSIMDKIFPMTLRPQAHDIITFWLFNTVVKSLMHEGKVPFRDVMISGHGLDPKGKKMSKSKGNVVEPLGVIEKYSADAVRYWSASARLGNDLPYAEKDVVTGQKLLTKMWNASKFVKQFISKTEKPELKIMDKWLLNKLMKLIEKATKSFEEYEYADARRETEMFFWHTFADNYLEIVKYRAYADDDSAKWTLYKNLLTILKLFSPIIPFITEEIYQNMFKENEKDISIHISSWPEVEKEFIDKEIEEIGDMTVAVISSLRQYKSSKGLALNSEVEKLTIECDEDAKKKLENTLEDIKGTMKVKDIEFGKGEIEVEGYEIKIGVM